MKIPSKCIAVGLRLWARSRTIFRLGMHDYVIIVAVVHYFRRRQCYSPVDGSIQIFCTVYVGLSILACRYGLGKHGLEAAYLEGFAIVRNGIAVQVYFVYSSADL